MNQQSNLSKRHQINTYYYNEAFMNRNLERNNSNDRLLVNHQDHNIQQLVSQFGQFEIKQNKKVQFTGLYQSYFYPNFLTIVGECCVPCRIIFPCLFCQFCGCQQYPLYQQNMTNVGILQQWGSFKQFLKPGLHIINPLSQMILMVNQQTKVIQFDQTGISRDNVQFNLKIIIFYRVIDSYKFSYRLKENEQQTCVIDIAISSLRNFLGQNLLQTIVENKTLITLQLTRELNRELSYWGIYVEMSSIKQMKIDEQIARVLQSVAIGRRISESKLIDFKADVQTGKLIKQISEILSNSASFQIRYLKTIQQIINNGNQNVIILKTSLYNKDNQIHSHF